MQNPTLDDLNQKLVQYLQGRLKNELIHTDTKLIDLGFESIDYIELSAYLIKNMGRGLDISKLNKNTTIAHLSSCSFNLTQETINLKNMVKLDDYQKYCYTIQLNDPRPAKSGYIILYMCLKNDMDWIRLKQAIEDTLNNHYILNSKLIRVVDDYFFEQAPTQSNFTFKGSFLFPKRDLDQLVISIHSERLVNIYIQRKRRKNYLIIAFHHIALDGWSYRIIQEEIFRRYAGLYHLPPKKATQDIPALNQIYPASIDVKSNTDELRELLSSIQPNQFNRLNHIFYGNLQLNYHCLLITKEELQHYAQVNNIHDFSHSVIFTYMYYQMIRQVTETDKLIIYQGLSNRLLPIEGVHEILANFITGLPIFLNNENMENREFAAKIDETLTVYFKHMSYGAIMRILLENNTVLNELLSPFRQPYCLLFNYINNISKMIHGNNSILNQYINYQHSITHLNNKNGKGIFVDVHNMGDEFCIQIFSRMVKNVHLNMIHQYLLVNFPNLKEQL